MMKPKKIDALIGLGSIFEGFFQVNGILWIEGTFKGQQVSADQVYVAPEGEVYSEIKGGAVIVEGKVVGNIVGFNRVMLMPGSKIYGDITTPELITQKGVILEGKCTITQNV
ncbi:MAG: cell division protein [Spirochaetae bacterium HGW-Spirochaetae-6]|nr:MAG: cell division protein [Spirochaetae bacterium HGW-Spirochaetae-6]